MNTVLKDFLATEIRPMMKTLGYRKSGGCFYRQNEHFAYTIRIERPVSAVYQDEFIIGASIFSYEIADVIGHKYRSRNTTELHWDHYTLYHNDIIGESDSISISDYDTAVLGEFIRKALTNLDEFFRRIGDIDTFLELLLENGCGRNRFFSDSVVRYALLTRRWEYAEQLIRKEAERREGWEFPRLLAEKYKELCNGDTGHRAFTVSWDQSLLRNRTAPQGIKILTAEEPFYLLFIRSIGHYEIDFSASLYDRNKKFSSYSEFQEDPDCHSIAYPVLPKKYAGRDLIYIENGKETYMSERLIKAFCEAKIKGISFSAIGTLRFR